MKIHKSFVVVLIALSMIASVPATVEAELMSDMDNAVGVTVNYISVINEEVLETLKENGITYVRIPFMYPFIPDGVTVSSTYLYTKKAAKLCKEAGIEVLGQTFWPGGVGYNAKSKQIEWLSNIPALYKDFDDPEFYQLAKDAVRFIASDMEGIIDFWLVSNEPDISTFTGDMTPEQICRYISECVDGILEANPDAECGINLLGRVNEEYSQYFIDSLYGENSKLSWLGLDGYYGTLQEGGPETWDQYISDFEAMAENVPIIITEWSYSSATSDPLNTCRYQWENHVRGVESQAEYVAASMEVFARHRIVQGVFWYALADSYETCWECGNPQCTLYSSWGLLKTNSTPKPALYAMKTASELFRNRE